MSQIDSQEIEDLRSALRWALAMINRLRPIVEPWDGEDGEDWGGACRLAWPDNPEEWD